VSHETHFENMGAKHMLPLTGWHTACVLEKSEAGIEELIDFLPVLLLLF